MSVNWSAAATYVLGAQSLKVGYQGALLYDERQNRTNNQYLQYRFQNGVPDQMTLTISDFPVKQRVRADSWYAQDQWTRGRMTLQGALRYDHAWSYFPEAQVGPTRFFPNPVVYPDTKGVTGYNDLTPRAGIAFDVFGTGKTAVKANIGRYLEAAQNGGLFIASRPSGRLQTTTTRSWTDANKNFVADCDLLNERATGSSLQGRRFLRRVYDADVRDGDFRHDAGPRLCYRAGASGRAIGRWARSVEQQLLPRVSVGVRAISGAGS